MEAEQKLLHLLAEHYEAEKATATGVVVGVERPVVLLLPLLLLVVQVEAGVQVEAEAGAGVDSMELAEVLKTVVAEQALKKL